MAGPSEIFWFEYCLRAAYLISFMVWVLGGGFCAGIESKSVSTTWTSFI